MNTNEANLIAHGIKPAASLEEYYQAWQVLKNSNTFLCESDQYYIEKLVCDGVINWEPQ